jgi:hypothetical protein
MIKIYVRIFAYACKEEVMANIDYRQVIIDYLSVPAVTVSDKPMGSGWHAIVSRGGTDARLETIQFGKQRSIPGKIIQFVTFEDMQEMKHDYTCYLIQNTRGMWNFTGGAGGSDSARKIVREHPWANLGGGGWPDEFYAGGYVIDNGLDIVRVRLVAHNGTVLEDTVQDGIVLFVTDAKVELPLQAELYDREDRLVANHSVFNSKPI